ncbi:anti-sigma factor [Streptomyces sp. C10-9-1]|uniref:anti-sigma factor n=1 Tax=Streptomyces sp. C10-9-1 TaxID=1859285 RepID=UPI003F4A84D9
MADHPDPGVLLELALGGPGAAEALAPGDRAHLGACDRCRAELDGLRRVASAARAATLEDLLTAPPPRVWDALARDLGLPGAAEQTPETGPARAPDPPPGAARAGRNWRRRSALALAAVCLAAGAAAGGAAARWTAGGGEGSAVLGDVHVLAAVSGTRAAGTVTLETGPGPDRRMRLAVERLPPTDGYYEVWLTDRTGTRVIAVGVLGPAGRATLPLPAGVDLGSYPLVDVSVEAYDGRPEHSGRSVVRGPVAG